MLFWKDHIIIAAQGTVNVVSLNTLANTSFKYDSLASTALLRDYLYIAIKETICIVDLVTMKEIKAYTIPGMPTPIGICLNTTRMVIGLPNEMLLVDMTLLDLPTEWIEAFTNTEKMLSLIESNKAWRSSMDHSYLMACVQYAPVKAMQSIIKQESFLTPNAYGESTLSVVIQTSNMEKLEYWDRNPDTVDVTDMSTIVLGDALYHMLKFYQKEHGLIHRLKMWLVPGRVSQIMHQFALKEMHFSAFQVFKMYQEYNISFNAEGFQSKVPLIHCCVC